MKKFIGEFKEFISRGSVVDLAVGIIIGSAFTAIVTSLVNDLIMPLISLLTGGVNFQDWFVSLDGSHYATLAEAQEAGASTLNYGSFIAAVINFIIVALVIFMLVKSINNVRKKTQKEEAPAAPTTKICPYCKSEVPIEATKCAHCTSDLPAEEEK